MSKDRSSSSGIGVTGLLGVLFVGLKLTHFIDWSWWWVLAPFWVWPAAFVGLVVVIGIGLSFVAVLESIQERRRNAQLRARFR